MADGNTMLRVKKIIESDPERRYVVVSAPGKRFGGDTKITDLLYDTFESVKLTGKPGAAFGKVAERFRGIVHELALDMDIDALLKKTEREIVKEGTADFVASRGEYLSGCVMAALLGIPFIDARDVVKFNAEGRLDSDRTYSLLAEALRGKPRAVVAGFYGEDAEGRVKTFSRGGSWAWMAESCCAGVASSGKLSIILFGLKTCRTGIAVPACAEIWACKESFMFKWLQTCALLHPIREWKTTAPQLQPVWKPRSRCPSVRDA